MPRAGEMTPSGRRRQALDGDFFASAKTAQYRFFSLCAIQAQTARNASASTLHHSLFLSRGLFSWDDVAYQGYLLRTDRNVAGGSVPPTVLLQALKDVYVRTTVCAPRCWANRATDMRRLYYALDSSVWCNSPPMTPDAPCWA